MSLRFEWIPELVEKNRAKHGVEPEDVESALLNTDPVPYYHRLPQGKYLAMAQVEDDGPYLYVILSRPKPRVVRTISATQMEEDEKRAYRKRIAGKK